MIFILNKIDKCVILTIIVMLFAIVFPLSLLLFSLKYNVELLFEILFFLMIFVFLFVLPICLIIQIITFIKKIFANNKLRKDWIIILINFISLILFSFILFCYYGIALVL